MVNKVKGVTVLMTTTYKACTLCYPSHLLIISTLLYRYYSHLNYLDEKLRLLEGKFIFFSHQPPCWSINTPCRAHFGSTYPKIGMIQRRFTWPLCKDDMQIPEAFHIFLYSNTYVWNLEKWY